MTDNRGNTGNSNTGNWNTGYRNTGYRNTGNSNTGRSNTGNNNTGYSNTGYRNTGDWNTGNRNTGHSNTGYRNTGNWSTGDMNTGSWNACNKETGFFNTQETDTVRVFNKECSKVVWDKADKPDFIYFNLTEWVYESDMTDQEKIDHPTFPTTGGYLKSCEYKEAFQKSWDEADEEDRAKLFELPNFDAEVFKEISGIDVTEKPKSCAGKIVEIDGKKYTLKEVK